MGVLFDYFSAGTDEQAAHVIEAVGGPGSLAHDTVSLKGIDPIVQLGTLEELLTGRAYDEVIVEPRSGDILAERDGGERLVVTLSDSLATALADADDAQLVEVARPWSQTEEFWGAGDADLLAECLRDLSALAARARDTGRRLYCWVCV